MPNGSRFWTFTPWAVLLAAGLSMYHHDPSVFTGITLIWMGAAGAKSSIESHHKGANGK